MRQVGVGAVGAIAVEAVAVIEVAEDRTGEKDRVRAAVSLQVMAHQGLLGHARGKADHLFQKHLIQKRTTLKVDRAASLVTKEKRWRISLNLMIKYL